MDRLILIGQSQNSVVEYLRMYFKNGTNIPAAFHVHPLIYISGWHLLNESMFWGRTHSQYSKQSEKLGHLVCESACS